ncbi:hypothetical protein K458DRAFT_390839 [Lentithecium fluviatile CBS 122367]|uniref:Uncharacterized protein n=1 Tax=Lentithecium fluviatile CBS 122367 TaxID=1168545 RepID=A0A6G1IVS7_9PLEO|nr:hypothetical protein K458DRAFT_390839 [Lentithecium fluviatile CBS 122367]
MSMKNAEGESTLTMHEDRYLRPGDGNRFVSGSMTPDTSEDRLRKVLKDVRNPESEHASNLMRVLTELSYWEQLIEDSRVETLEEPQDEAFVDLSELEDEAFVEVSEMSNEEMFGPSEPSDEGPEALDAISMADYMKKISWVTFTLL